MAGTRTRVRIGGDLGFRLLTGGFAVLVIAIVVGIGFELWRQSQLSIQKFGFKFWVHEDVGPRVRRFRRAALHLGHALLVRSWRCLISTPVALGIAIFLSELAPNWLRQPLSFLTELLAAIPSIVYGLWGIFVLVPCGARPAGCTCRAALRSTPFFSGPPLGVGMLSAALILAVMVMPFTSSVAREVLKAVPVAQREAAYALGATQWEAIRAALFYARTGIVGAVMLGFGRALGETMAVTMVIGNNPQVSLVVVRAAVHDGGGASRTSSRKRATNSTSTPWSRSAWCCSSSRCSSTSLSRLLIWSMTRSRCRRSRGPFAAVPAPEAHDPG